MKYKSNEVLIWNRSVVWEEFMALAKLEGFTHFIWGYSKDIEDFIMMGTACFDESVDIIYNCFQDLGYKIEHVTSDEIKEQMRLMGILN